MHRATQDECLILAFRDDKDGTGSLHAAIVANGFQGEGSACFSTNELRNLVASLRLIPLPAESRLRVAGGFYSQTEHDVLKDALLSIEFYPVGRRGQIGVRVHVETEVYPNDREDSRNQATVELLTTYARLDEFAKQFDELITGGRSQAQLTAETIS